MEAKGLTPILNVSDIASTFAWFEKWGWKKLWDWGTPPTFGAVGSGKQTRIFLCQGAQGGRGRGASITTFSGREMKRATRESGCRSGWTTWTKCTSTASPSGWRSQFPPTDIPWNVREMHLRHPDGHLFRISRGFEPEK